MKIINCTPHDINIIDTDGNITKTFESSGICPRVATQVSSVGEFEGVSFFTSSFGNAEGLPVQAKNTLYVVSRMVREATPDRLDLIVPSGIVRDGKGKVAGCTGFETPDPEALLTQMGFEICSFCGATFFPEDRVGYSCPVCGCQ